MYNISKHERDNFINEHINEIIRSIYDDESLTDELYKIPYDALMIKLFKNMLEAYIKCLEDYDNTMS